MTGKALGEQEESTEEAAAEQAAKALQVNITNPEKKQRIRRALRAFGWTKAGTGVTLVLLAFADDERVRSAVRRWLGGTAPAPVEEQ